MEPFPELPQEPLPEPRRISFAPLIIAAVAFTLVVVIVASNLQEEPVFEKIDTLTIHFLSNRGLPKTHRSTRATRYDSLSREQHTTTRESGP